MAVETRFVVIRNKVEVKTFMDKKDADEYDKMLEMADSIDELLSNSPIKLSDPDRESLSFYLAKQKEELLIALQAKKPKKPKIKDIIETVNPDEEDLKEAC